MKRERVKESKSSNVGSHGRTIAGIRILKPSYEPKIEWLKEGKNEGVAKVGWCKTSSITQDKLIERISKSFDLQVSAENVSNILVGELLKRVTIDLESIAASLEEIVKQKEKES